MVMFVVLLYVLVNYGGLEVMVYWKVYLFVVLVFFVIMVLVIIVVECKDKMWLIFNVVIVLLVVV